MSLWFLSVLGAGRAGSASALAHAFRADTNEANDRYRRGGQVSLKLDSSRQKLTNLENADANVCNGEGEGDAEPRHVPFDAGFSRD